MIEGEFWECMTTICDWKKRNVFESVPDCSQDSLDVCLMLGQVGNDSPSEMNEKSAVL